MVYIWRMILLAACLEGTGEFSGWCSSQSINDMDFLYDMEKMRAVSLKHPLALGSIVMTSQFTEHLRVIKEVGSSGGGEIAMSLIRFAT